MRWLKNLLKKRDYHYTSSMYDFFKHYTDSEAELSAMKHFIREQNRSSPYWSCDMLRLMASKDVRFRYGLEPYHVRFVWYLLEQYYKGNITIKKDVQSIAGGEIHT